MNCDMKDKLEEFIEQNLEEEPVHDSEEFKRILLEKILDAMNTENIQEKNEKYSDAIVYLWDEVGRDSRFADSVVLVLAKLILFEDFTVLR